MFVFQSQDMVSTLEVGLQKLQTEHDALKLKQEKVRLSYFNCGFSITVSENNGPYSFSKSKKNLTARKIIAAEFCSKRGRD